jgi:hypothetical protein
MGLENVNRSLIKAGEFVESLSNRRLRVFRRQYLPLL